MVCKFSLLSEEVLPLGAGYGASLQSNPHFSTKYRSTGPNTKDFTHVDLGQQKINIHLTDKAV